MGEPSHFILEQLRKFTWTKYGGPKLLFLSVNKQMHLILDQLRQVTLTKYGWTDSLDVRSAEAGYLIQE